MSDHGRVPRRTVITGALAMAATTATARTGAAGLAVLAPPPNRANPTLATGELADWQALVGALFAARTEIGPVSLRLAAVRPFSAEGRRPAALPRQRAFEAVFTPLGGKRPMGNTVYAVSGPRGGSMPIYFGPNAGTLTAVFN
jgi:hypothetical protein